MADTKISALPASTTPLAGTEVLPIVQSGVTKQVSVANLTAGRAISATSVTASAGNFVVGTSGNGVDFSATPGTGTSELLADYEEGSFQPSWSSTGASFTYDATFRHGRYIKVGRMVYFNAYLSTGGAPTGTTSNALTITGLPFTSANNDNGDVSACYYGQLWNVDWPLLAIFATANIDRSQTKIDLRWERDATNNISWTAAEVLAGSYVLVSGSYMAAS